MSKTIKHIKCWNEWRKNSLNSKLHKFLVLIGAVYSPTFEVFKAFHEEGTDDE